MAQIANKIGLELTKMGEYKSVNVKRKCEGV
jgi:hypothetical protein